MIKRGEDKEINITIQDSGVGVNLTTFVGIIAILTTDSRKPLAYYSREPYTDSFDNVYDVVDFIQDPDQVTNPGLFKIRVQSDITKAAPCEKFYFEIKLQTEDVDFDNSSFMSVTIVNQDTDGVRFEFVDSITKDDIDFD